MHYCYGIFYLMRLTSFICKKNYSRGLVSKECIKNRKAPERKNRPERTGRAKWKKMEGEHSQTVYGEDITLLHASHPPELFTAK